MTLQLTPWGAAKADRGGGKRRLTMTKFLIGVATAALWFALSHAANAERMSRQVCDQVSDQVSYQVCDNGTCMSRPV